MSQRIWLALTLLCGSAVAAIAQGDLSSWYSVPSNQAGLVLIIDGFPVDSVVVTGSGGDVLDQGKWGIEAPLVRQYRVDPGTYEVQFSDEVGSPVKAIALSLDAGTLSFIELEPYTSAQGTIGTQFASWTGDATPEVDELLFNLQQNYPDLAQPVYLDAPGNVLDLNISPTWPRNGTDDPGPSIHIE